MAHWCERVSRWLVSRLWSGSGTRRAEPEDGSELDGPVPGKAQPEPEPGTVDLRTPATREILGSGRLRQSTPTTCGSMALLAAAITAHPRTAPVLTADLRARETATARWTAGGWRRTGFLLPWPRFWGTAPWAASAAMTAITGRRHGVHRIDPRDPSPAQATIRAALRQGSPALVYVGNARLPRHVVLAVAATDAAVTVFDPADGRLHDLAWSGFGDGLRIAGWGRVWALVVPREGTGHASRASDSSWFE